MNTLENQSKPLNTFEISKDKIIEYLDAFGFTKILTDKEKQQFIEIACEYKLNPFKREIYCIPFGEGEYKKLSIIVGYETYIKRAERTGKLDGWKVHIEGSGKEMRAIVVIYRKDWNKPFQHEVFFDEASQKKKDGELTQFWRKQPRFQLKKVAISQGFRLCFPDELGGIPYDFSEMQDDIYQSNQSNKISIIPKEQSNIKNTDFDLKSSLDSETEEIDSEEDIRDKIEDFIERNSIHIPPAHSKWIKQQLHFNLSKQKLMDIFEHIVTYVNNLKVNKSVSNETTKQKVLILD